MSWTFDNGTILTKAALVGEYENNAFAVACAQTGKAVIIDAAAEPERVLELADGMDVQAVLTTHGISTIYGRWRRWWSRSGCRSCSIQTTMRWRRSTRRSAPYLYWDDEVISLGDTSLLTIHTPGHTRGSVCFLSPGVLFSGDTLFPGGPGATQFKPRDFDMIIKSIEERLLVLGDETRVYPGHGPTKTSIAEARRDIPEWIERGW